MQIYVMKSAASLRFPSIQQQVRDSFLLPFNLALIKTALPCPYSNNKKVILFS